jgi:hypothetical protein
MAHGKEDLAGTWIKIFLLLVVLAAPAGGQPQASEEELAKQTQNPVADLISLPLQNNFNFGAGFRSNKMVYVLNVQPVLPFRLSDEWNLVTRTIMPIIHQPAAGRRISQK